jgi:hypothetical protein
MAGGRREHDRRPIIRDPAGAVLALYQAEA